jgi:hypothetical protein
VLIVGTDASAVEADLTKGRMSCPNCGARRQPWGFGVCREVRLLGRSEDGHAARLSITPPADEHEGDKLATNRCSRIASPSCSSNVAGDRWKLSGRNRSPEDSAKRAGPESTHCQGEGRGFKSRRPLQENSWSGDRLVRLTLGGRSGRSFRNLAIYGR